MAPGAGQIGTLPPPLKLPSSSGITVEVLDKQ
jgi:hypothetical protein